MSQKKMKLKKFRITRKEKGRKTGVKPSTNMLSDERIFFF